MKIFKNIKIMWLQHRVYNYTLKADIFFSKSKAYEQLSVRYLKASKHWLSVAPGSAQHLNYNVLATKAEIESARYLSLHNIYLEKKSKAKEELFSLLGTN